MTAIHDFFTRVSAKQPFQTVYDEEWPSTCFLETPESGQVAAWAPCKKQGIDISGLEQAFEFPIHASIYQFFGQYWSDHITVEFEDEQITLLFLWNEQDENQLLQNQVGHMQQKRRLKLPMTLFIGITEADSVITIDNETGEVLIEGWPKKAGKVIAPSLEAFLEKAVIVEPEED